MIRPTRDEFRALAERYSVVPVWQELLADLTTPVAAFTRVVGDEAGFLLESVEHGERWGRWSFIGRRPTATIVARGPDLEIRGALPPSVPRDRGILAAIEAVLAAYRSPPPTALPALGGLPPLHGGLVGYLGYDVVREVERLPNVPPDELGHPDAVVSVIGQLAAYDHWRQRVTLIDSVPLPAPGGAAGGDATDVDRRYDEAVARLAEMARDGARNLDEPLVEPPLADEELPAVSRRTSPRQYCDAVEAAKEHILAGDAFQVVLAQRFDLQLDADAFDLYRALRQVNPSPYMYFLRSSGLDVIGSSPEPMVQLLDGRVISRPIAGTRRRGRTDEEDRRMAAELSEHPKEIAEHVMLVDLARNDVGRVVAFGTEHVDELLTLERYSHVMHLTSQVSGALRPGLGPIDVLRATLPAGTVSGAPKVRAMEIIDDLEPTKRGPYAGIVGYLDFSGNVDTAIAIRTMLVGPGGRASVTAGAGVVADSDPALEDLECRNKAAALLAAVPVARRITAARRAQGASGAPPSLAGRDPSEAANGQTGAMAGRAGDLQTEYRLLREGVGAVWVARDAVSVSGPAAVAFLQGQVSQDVASLLVGASAWTWVLQPQGKVEALCRVTRVSDDHLVLDTDGGWGQALATRLNRFKLRTKADIVTEEWRCLALRGPGVDGVVPNDGGGALALDASWPGLAGVDLLGAEPVLPPGVALVSDDAFEVVRIEAGIPRMGAELTEKTIPAETGLVARTVSFTKGCFTGQELVARIDSRGGNVARRLRRVVLDEVAPVGAPVAVAGKVAGTLTSVAAHPDGGAVALAYLGRDVAPPAEVSVTWDGGTTNGRADVLPTPI